MTSVEDLHRDNNMFNILDMICLPKAMYPQAIKACEYITRGKGDLQGMVGWVMMIDHGS